MLNAMLNQRSRLPAPPNPPPRRPVHARQQHGQSRCQRPTYAAAAPHVTYVHKPRRPPQSMSFPTRRRISITPGITAAYPYYSYPYYGYGGYYSGWPAVSLSFGWGSSVTPAAAIMAAITVAGMAVVAAVMAAVAVAGAAIMAGAVVVVAIMVAAAVADIINGCRNAAKVNNVAVPVNRHAGRIPVYWVLSGSKTTLCGARIFHHWAVTSGLNRRPNRNLPSSRL